MTLTAKLKQTLWKCYGSSFGSAEWDGNVYGGGRLSQRFWEYHQTIELLELTPDSVVLDIGGGSPATGAGFFARLIAPHVKQVHVMDINTAEHHDPTSKIILHRKLAAYDSLLELLQKNPTITKVACISVFEHIPSEVRCGMIKALNEGFTGDPFVATLEFHAKNCHFEYQLTTRTISEMFGQFTNFYPEMIHQSPFWCENAFKDPSIGQRILRKLGVNATKWQAEVPLWYPVALQFRRLVE